MLGDRHIDVLSKDTREGAAGTGAVALSYTTRPAVTASGLTTEDLMVDTNDRSLTTLEIATEITVSWSGAETAVETVDVTLFASTSSTNEASVGRTPSAFTVNSPSKKGQRWETMEAISLLSNNGGALSASTDMTISMNETLKDAGKNQLQLKPDAQEATYQATVQNESTTASASGTANTSGS